MNTRFSELAPWYVNGTLSDDDRKWVDAYVAEHPQARAELAWYESLRARLQESAPQVSDEIGLARTMSRIHAERSTAPTTRARVGDRDGPAPAILRRIRDWIGSANFAPAFAVAAAIVAVQGVVIGTLTQREEPATSEFRTLPPSAQEVGPLLKVNFRPNAREEDLRLLLVQANATLAGGPTQLGDWYVRVPGTRVEQSAAILRSSPLVESVSAVDAIPARE